MHGNNYLLRSEVVPWGACNCGNRIYDFLGPRPEKLQAGKWWRTIARLASNAFAKGAERKECKGIFQYLADHCIEVVSRELAQVGVCCDFEPTYSDTGYAQHGLNYPGMESRLPPPSRDSRVP